MPPTRAGHSRRPRPIANEFKLPINLLASSDWAGFASRIKREHRGKVGAVVGYATTIPGVLSELSASSVAIAEDDYDSIFLVVLPSPGPTRIFRLAITGRRRPPPARRR